MTPPSRSFLLLCSDHWMTPSPSPAHTLTHAHIYTLGTRSWGCHPWLRAPCHPHSPGEGGHRGSPGGWRKRRGQRITVAAPESVGRKSGMVSAHGEADCPPLASSDLRPPLVILSKGGPLGEAGMPGGPTPHASTRAGHCSPLRFKSSSLCAPPHMAKDKRILGACWVLSLPSPLLTNRALGGGIPPASIHLCPTRSNDTGCLSK